MNKKNFLSAKKIFWILIFFSIIFFNWEKIFADENINLNKKLQEIQNQIKKLDKWKNFCDDIKKTKKENSEKNFVSKDFNKTFYPEDYWISKKWISARDKFLEDISVWWFQEIADSFTIQFSWNYCFQRDLQKIDKVLYWSIDFWAKLAEKCQTWSVIKIKEIIWKTDEKWNISPSSSIKMLKKNFENEKKFFQEDLYWNSPKKCKEDSITDATKKIKEFKEKIKKLTEWDWSFFDNFSFDKDEMKKIQEQAKIDAQSYLTENLNATLQSLWIKAIIDEKWKKENIFQTIARVWWKQINKLKNLFSNNDKDNRVEVKWDINNFLNQTEFKKQNSDFAKYAKEDFQENQIFNDLEEDATNKIIANLEWLKIDIIRSNWNKKELWEVKKIAKKVLSKTEDKDAIKEFKKIENEWTWSKDLKTLKNFILEFSKFLWKHNEAAWTVESKWILNYWWKNDYN